MKEFDKPLSHEALNLNNKIRSNIFTWRGQFSPELIDNLIEAYCPSDSTILDPFCGSGTVLCEAGYHGLKSIGIEVNPAAYILSKTYEFINLSKQQREELISGFLKKVKQIFPEPPIFQYYENEVLLLEEFENKTYCLRNVLNNQEKILLDAFVIILDIFNNDITRTNIYIALDKLIKAVKNYPTSSSPIKAALGDARSIPLEKGTVDFVITSPPYINVFNYHQNYRKSAELLGWDLLKIARAEIGSNRANRGNRFLTVIQYCIDMAYTLREICRVCSSQAKVIFVVGHESRVLGVPFFNADIISALAIETGLFKCVLRQSRQFKNKFGKIIREDLLHFQNTCEYKEVDKIETVARTVAFKVLNNSIPIVLEKNRNALLAAIAAIPHTNGIPRYSEDACSYYQNKSKFVTAG